MQFLRPKNHHERNSQMGGENQMTHIEPLMEILDHPDDYDPSNTTIEKCEIIGVSARRR